MHERRARISVILPAYKCGQFIDNIVESIYAQTWMGIQLVIVDDDHTQEFRELERILILASAARPDIEIVSAKTPSRASGPAVARNIGLDKAKNRYICFFDCDDFWEPSFLSSMFREINVRNVPVVVCHALTKTQEKTFLLRLPTQYGRFQLLQTNLLSMPCVMVDLKRMKKKRFPVCGSEDYAFWLSNIYDDVAVAVLPEVLVTINKTPGSVSSQWIRSAKWYISLLRDEKPKTHLFIFFFVMYAINAFNKRYGFIDRVLVF